MLKRAITAAHVSSEWNVPPVSPAPKLTAQKLKRAARLRKEIDSLRKELARMLQPGR